jgi:hypothetical protein
MKFAKKLLLRVKNVKWCEKILFFLPFLLKVVCAFFLSILAPIMVFLLFISVEPREIEAVNDYLYNTVKTKIGEEVDGIKTAKISFDRKFRLYYIIDNSYLESRNYKIKISKTIIGVNPLDLFRSSGNIIKQIEFTDPEVVFDIPDSVNLIHNKKNFEIIFEQFLDVFQSKRTLLVNKFRVNNGKIIVNNLQNNTSDVLFLINANFGMKRNKKDVDIKFTINTKINDKNTIKTSNTCFINHKLKNLECDFVFDNVSMNDIVMLSKSKNEIISEYSKNIIGKFDLKLSLDISKQDGIKSVNFLIVSESGTLKLKKLFGDEVNYRDLSIGGNIKDNGNIVNFDEIVALIATKKDKKFNKVESNVFFHKKHNINTTIKLIDNDAKNLNTLWPVFLDQLDIRKWVIEHVKSGQVDSMYVYLNFNFINDKYTLDKVDSNFNFQDVTLDYDDDFPPLSNMKGTAFFSKNDMKIRIDSASSYGTKITSGEIYIDFDAVDITYIDIKGQLYGDIYYLGYYINYANKDSAKDIIDIFFNGKAQSSIKLKIPIENIDSFDIFKLSAINIQSELINNNNYIFKDDSSSYLVVDKKINSNIFDIKIDLMESNVDIKIVDLTKKKGQNGIVTTSVVINKDKVLLKDIKLLYNKNINFNGEGVINNGILENLTIHNIKYGNLLYDLRLSFDANKNATIVLTGDKLKINLDKKDDKAKYYNLFTKIFDINVNLSCAVKNLEIGSYQFDDTTVDFKYNDGDLDKIEIKNNILNVNLSNNRKKNLFQININIKNIGKLLYGMNIAQNVVGGNLYGNFTLDENDKIDGRLKITDNFEIITNNIKQTNIYRNILDNSEVSEKFKKNLLENNSIAFSKADANLEIKDNVLRLERFLFNSGENNGMGLSGFGTVNLESGNIEIEGLIIPFDKINTIFGMNKIPVINNLLFKNKDGALLTISYKFKKPDYNSNYTFKIIPSSVASPNFLKNVVLLLMFL